MSWVAAGIGIVSAGTAIYTGIKQKKEAKNLLNKERPVQEVPEALRRNQTIAENMAMQGLPGAEYARAQQNINRNQNAAIKFANDRRGGLGSIAAIQQNSNDANLNLDARNAMQKQANIRSLLGVNSQIGGAQQDAFNWNQKAQYNQNRDYGMNLLGAGNANIIGGLDSGLAAAGRFASSYGGGSRNSASAYGGGGGGGYSANLDNSYRSIDTTRAIGSNRGPSLGIDPSAYRNPYLGTRR